MEKSWKSLPVATPRMEATHCYCAVSVGNKLMVVAQDSLGNCIYRYDTEINVWERLPYSGDRISHLCATDEYMYAVDILGQSPQKCDFVIRQWQTFAGVPKNCNLSGAVVLNSKMYVLERDRIQFMKRAVLHCFDPQKNRCLQDKLKIVYIMT